MTIAIMVRRQPSVVIIPIRIQLEWTDTPQGKVVTETVTEYKEVTDDSDFAGFGPLSDHQHSISTSSSFPKLASTGAKPKSKAKADSSAESADSSDEEEAEAKFAEEALKAHNEYRSKHGVKPLKLNKKLCSYAQEWAEKLASQDRMEHRSDNKYGENIFSSWSSNPKAKIGGPVPVESWYSEVAKHTFGQEPRSMGTGHFTQVVWKDSKELGIGKARSKSGKWFVVGNYDPPGNFIGKYTENVLPPKN